MVIMMMMMMMMMMNDEDFDGSVLIYFMMIKKRELADVIIVNICLFLSLKEIYHMFTYTKKQTKFEKHNC